MQVHHHKQQLEVKTHSVRIIEGTLVVDGIIVPYEKQIIRSHDTMFITDLAVQIPISEQLRAYDEYYFHHTLKKQLLYEIEANHFSIGLEVLQQMPNLQAEHYQYLISKISLKKLAKILLDDDFVMFLCNSFRRVSELPLRREEEEKMGFVYLTQPYQRVAYLLNSIEQRPGILSQKLEITGRLFIYDLIGQSNFINHLAYPPHLHSNKTEDETERSTTNEIDTDFLRKLAQITIYLRYFEKGSINQEKIGHHVIEKHPNISQSKEKNQNKEYKGLLTIIQNQIFNKTYLNFIGKHFQTFFQYNRKDFLLILTLTAACNRDNFWDHLIHFMQESSPSDPSKQALVKKHINNSDCLRQFMLNNYYSKDKLSWDQSMYLLQELGSSTSAGSMLIDIYHDLLQFPLKVETIDLICDFIQKVVKINKEISPHFKLLLSSFMESIFSRVDQLHTIFCRFSKRVSSFQHKNLLMLMRFPKFPKIKSVLICAFLRVFSTVVSLDLMDDFSISNFEKSIQQIIAMTKGNEGATFGAKAGLFNTIKNKANIQIQQLSQTFSPSKQYSIMPQQKQATIQRLNRLISQY